MCPKLTRIAELVLTMAWKGAFKVKIIKTDLRNRLKNDMLEGLMHLTVNGPDICTDQCDDLITSSVKNWLQTKSRRKLPSRNKGNKYNLLFYSSKNYHICSYKIIKMNWLNGRFSFIYFVYNIHHLNTEIENLNYFLGGFLINVTVISVIQYTNMPVLFKIKHGQK